MKLTPTASDLLDTLAAETLAEPEGTRNTELFRRARVALEAGYEPEEVDEVMSEAGLASGLKRSEVKATLESALRAERAERVQDGTPPQAPSLWADTWERTWPRLVAVDADKRPMQRWQYGWDEPNDELRKGGKYYAVVIPPGLAVLDIDDSTEFYRTGLDLEGNPHRYQSISGTPGKGHVWYRLHPDRPYPTRAMRAWPGADLLVGGMGIANIRDRGILDAIGDPADLPMAPDWMQPRPSSRIQNISDYLSGVPDVIPWLIEKVAFVHGLTIIAGSPKAGKSTLVFEAMRCRETGEAFLDQFTRPGPCLLVTEEGGVSVKFKGSELTELDVYDRKASEGEDFEKTLAVIADWCRDNAGGLVVIDTLAAWAGVEDENNSAEMQKAIDAIRLSITEPYLVAVILVHHARKGGGQHGEAIRGSGAILAAVDHVIEMKRATEQVPNRRSIHIMSRVMREEEKWLADWDGSTQRYAVVEDFEQPMSESVAEMLEKLPADGSQVTTKETGLHWRQLNRLVGTGLVRERRRLGSAGNVYWRVQTDETDEETDDGDEE